ncbi:hypothetical protein TanjilG_04098 [Lupinus angustifolius]|uniref:Auxin efflux carrier component n=2 Tax=Lupinus angustifolius TaxID=3871 RepID=A0A4P1RB17_LUPAN|nr:hypothetical protein TanjilG_04098 [Lupinus angustifolius]
MKAMYTDEANVLLAQIIVLQSLIWYNLLLFLLELHAAIPERTMPETTPSQGTGEMERSQEVESKEEEEEESEHRRTDMKVKILLIFMTVGKKLLKNPNTYGTLIGLIWASIHFRWGVHMPEVVNHSIEILSNGGLGMATFSLGLFMATQSSIIACGTKMTMVALALKFLVGPALMALASIIIGLRDTMFQVAIVQAALPQGIVPFVFAKEYNVHPAILSTGVLLGMLIALPVTLTYYVILEVGHAT